MRTRSSLIHAVREPEARSHDRAPLVLTLHGVGSNEQDLMSIAPLLDPRLMVVSARAPITLQHGSYAWYQVRFTSGGYDMNPEEAETSRVRILEFVDELTDSYNVDPDRMFLMGFSQGCIMSLSAALTRPRRFAGVVGMSGRMLPGLLEKRAPDAQLDGLPILITHGTEDTVLPIAEGRAIRDALSQLPVSLTYREYRIGHGISSESLADVQKWLTTQLNSTIDWRIAV